MYPDDIKTYIANLYSRVPEGKICGRAVIEGGNWQPVPNECHDNVDIWCNHNNKYKPVRGWLYFDLCGALNYVMFLQHSVVLSPDGKLYDITPSLASEDYPFIEVNESDEEFFKKTEFTKNGNLYHFK